MPSAKVLPKSALSKDKVKRKRTEDAVVTSIDKTVVGAPSKKSRRDDTDSATSKSASGHEPRPSGKRTKEKVKKTKEVVEVNMEGAEEKVEKTEKAKTKTVVFAESAPMVVKGARKAEKLRPELAVSLESGGDPEGSEASDPEEEEVHLIGFSSESDSSDEDLDVAEALPLDISQLPTFSKDDAVVQRKLERANKNPSEDKGVLYLGRIPHGFYEDQMRTYFSQFGDVSRLRLSRNKKTGHSKHYAFIEFSSSAVADIVGETMDNYLLMGHILKCKVIPKDQVHPELWVGSNKKWRFVPRDRLARLKQNRPRTQEDQQRAESKLVARQKKKQAKILATGIDYDFQDVAYKQKLKA